MSLRFRAAGSDQPDRVVLLARDPALIRAASQATQAVAAQGPRVVEDGRQALAKLFAAEGPPRQLVCQPSAAGDSWPALLAIANDPFAPTAVVVVQEPGWAPPKGVAAVPAQPAILAEALRRAASSRPQVPTEDPAALALGLARGEITARYQPVVAVAGGRPRLLEVLARWQRRDDTPLSPDAFVPLAERHGLARALAMAVADCALREAAPRALRVGAHLSLNLPLDVLVESDVPLWLDGLRRRHGFPSGALVLELTETAPVRDRSQLRRALLRLRQAGYPVLVDDMGLEEERDALLELPFAGIKLDRHLTSAMPNSRRARREVERLVQLAHARGMQVTAEGVSEARLWRAVAAAGVDNAQGYAIARPLPIAALPGWAAAWQARAVGEK